MEWNSKLYDNSQSYVADYGKDLVGFLPADANVSILDLGCGTGDLTATIFEKYKNIIGVDLSKEMLERAKSKYPEIKFLNIDATNMKFKNKFDVIFSNAVLHWILDQEKLHKNIYKNLQKGGILVCEFGANGNIEKIFEAYGEALKKYGQKFSLPFYFPTAANHIKLLKKFKFNIKTVYDFDRPTILPNGEIGLREWVLQFFSDSINQYNEDVREDILKSMENSLRNELFVSGSWIADYRRLRVIAEK